MRTNNGNQVAALLEGLAQVGAEQDNTGAGLPGPGVVSTDQFLQAQYANYIIFTGVTLALAYSFYCYWVIKGIVMDKDSVKLQELTDEEKEEMMAR